MIQKDEILKNCLSVCTCKGPSAETEVLELCTITGTCRLVGHSKFGTAQYQRCPIS